MTKLRISEDLALPIDFVVGTEADLATKGMGKSHLAQVIAEELLEHGQVFAAIDPTDAWWGLRSSADGKSDGYHVTAFGGDHADIQLEADAGVALADFVMEERRPIIICTEGLTQSGEVRVVREFLERIYRKNREPLKLFVDEADMFAPQKPDDPEDAKSIRAMRNIVRRGRKKGIGCMMITQRPAELNKGVLNMCDTLFVLGMESPLDIDPIEKWTRSKEPKVQAIADEMIESLTTLPVGDAWVVKKRAGLFKRFRARAKRTFDSGATPKPGQRLPVANKLAPIDIKAVGERIAAMVERQRGEDPKLLKARVAELERELAKKPAAKTETKTVEKAVIKDGQLTRIAKLIEQGEAVIKRWDDANANAHEALTAVEGRAKSWFGALDAALGELRDAVRSTIAPAPTNRQIAAAHFASDGKVTKHVGKHQIRVPANPGKPVVVGDTRLDPADLKFLSAVAWWASIGVDTPSLRAVSFIAEASSTSSSFANRRSKLRTLGLIAYPGPDAVALTPEGAELAPPAPPASIDVLQNKIKAALDPADVRMLDVLLDAYPDSVTLDDLADRIGASPTSSSFANRRSALKSLGLAEYPASGHVRASSLLFPEGLS